MQEGKKRRLFSRRTIVKIGSGLFAFIPAAQYLIDSRNALAYVPCAVVSCYAQEICTDPYCTGRKTWWVYTQCFDVRTKEDCGVSASDTGRAC